MTLTATLLVLNSYGASGVWVGTRFVASEEAGAPPKHKWVEYRSIQGIKSN
jgi:NAD(P)H-dependent flavin oxidoreductase YrpB (nitropropane dioxygenase family)